MTRMSWTALAIVATTLPLIADDVNCCPPGHKPFHTPKAPQPNGVLAPDVCFGYHATKWMPWGAACAQQNIKTTEVTKSCTSSAIILFDQPSTSTAPSQGKVTDMVKPMPPAKR